MTEQNDDLHVGLQMARPLDPEALEAERQKLRSLEQRPFVARTLAYFKWLGPGYLQSAMTLGGGTATASLLAGALFGYKLLWVAPLAMVFGVLMLSAVAHQTLSTGQRPYQAMKRFAGRPFALAWALGALISSIIWQFPQYSLSSAVLSDVADVAGYDIGPVPMSFVVLFWAVAFSFLYGASSRLARLYERALKYAVWGIVLCFGWVVLQTGISDWGALFRGFLAFEVPDDRNGVAAVTLILSGLAAAVGVNMLFLYPYTLLARGWGREHRRMARFDLGFGMLLPFSIATSLMIIATANTVNLDPDFTATLIKPIQVAQSLSTSLGPATGRVIFNLGILGMAVSSITLQMLTCGFVCSELFGWEFGGTKYRLATLLPTPGVLGAMFWNDKLLWIAIPTNIICGLFVPAAYIGFLILHRKRAYLGDDTPTGPKAKLFLIVMSLFTVVLFVSLASYMIQKLGAAT